MPQRSLHSMRKQLHSERAHAQWLVKQKAMHKQLVRCQMRIAQLVAVLDATYTSKPEEKERLKSRSFVSPSNPMIRM
jgi:hypothetical protein